MEKSTQEVKLSWALEWILANREVINVRGLETRAGLPWKSLQAFAIAGRDGYFPKKWIPQLEKTVSELNSCADNSYNDYADKLVDLWKEKVKERKVQENKGFAMSASVLNSKAEQVIDDIVYFHQAIKAVNPGAADLLALRIINRAGKNMAFKMLLK